MPTEVSASPRFLILALAFICVSLASACVGDNDNNERLRVYVTLGEFIDDPEGSLGSLLYVLGIIEQVNDRYRVSNLESAIDGKEYEESHVWLARDSLPSDFSIRQNQQEVSCVGVKVKISGEIGKISATEEIGLVSVESIFFLDPENLDTGLGRLCYSNFPD